MSNFLIKNNHTESDKLVMFQLKLKMILMNITD